MAGIRGAMGVMRRCSVRGVRRNGLAPRCGGGGVREAPGRVAERILARHEAVNRQGRELGRPEVPLSDMEDGWLERLQAPCSGEPERGLRMAGG